METQVQYAVCMSLISELYTCDSWCGETHIQKSAYFMQTLGKVESKWDFVLYKHGPYSFDLHETLDELKQMGFLELEIRPPYGPRIKLSRKGIAMLEKLTPCITEWKMGIQKTAQLLSNKSVQALEKLGTALLLSEKDTKATPEQLAQKMNEIKPHISLTEASLAIEEFQTLRATF